MKENDWLTCNDPQLMLAFLHARASERKLRLFAVYCCRGIWDRLEVGSQQLFLDVGSQQVLEVAERHAEGQATEEERQQAWEQARAVARMMRLGQDDAFVRPEIACAADAAAHAVGPRDGIVHVATAIRHMGVHRADLRGLQLQLLLEIFGNPFRPNAEQHATSASTVVAIAGPIYEQRAFDRLPILGDAMEDAGCTDAAMLNHCRQPGTHVRACWVVDLVLGKK